MNKPETPTDGLADAPCSARRALELCAVWTKHDIDRNTDQHGRAVLRHRLECIEQGLSDLSDTRPLMVTEVENNYLWHLAHNHKMTTTGEEPDALVLCELLQKIGDLREMKWPNAKRSDPAP